MLLYKLNLEREVLPSLFKQTVRRKTGRRRSEFLRARWLAAAPPCRSFFFTFFWKNFTSKDFSSFSLLGSVISFHQNTYTKPWSTFYFWNFLVWKSKNKGESIVTSVKNGEKKLETENFDWKTSRSAQIWFWFCFFPSRFKRVCYWLNIGLNGLVLLWFYSFWFEFVPVQ